MSCNKFSIICIILKVSTKSTSLIHFNNMNTIISWKIPSTSMATAKLCKRNYQMVVFSHYVLCLKIEFMPCFDLTFTLLIQKENLNRHKHKITTNIIIMKSINQILCSMLHSLSTNQKNNYFFRNFAGCYLGLNSASVKVDFKKCY